MAINNTVELGNTVEIEFDLARLELCRLMIKATIDDVCALSARFKSNSDGYLEEKLVLLFNYKTGVFYNPEIKDTFYESVWKDNKERIDTYAKVLYRDGILILVNS